MRETRRNLQDRVGAVTPPPDTALTIADRPDVIIGCEVTAVFPNDDVRVHLGVLGLPLLAMPLAAAMGHFLLEERFNRSLLFDLVARPAGAQVPEVA